MKGRRPFLSLTAGILACVIMVGCAGSVPTNGPSALNIAAFTVNNGVIGISYKFLLVASGGVQPYTWTISAGQLPPGLTLTTDGVIEGTPTQLGKFNFTAKVTDSQSPTQAYDTLVTSITINPTLSLTATALPTGLVNGPYSTTITATDGLPPYTYTLAANNNLPDGLTLTTDTNDNSATIAGTPTAAGTYNFTVQVKDSVSEVASAAYTIVVLGRLQGPYALIFNGFDNGEPFYDVAQIVASGEDKDGNGTITGYLDQMGPSGSVTSNEEITGTYNLGLNTNFGSLSITRKSDNTPLLNFAMVVSTTADTKVILSDSNAPQAYGSGLLKKQSATTLSGSAASYSFGQYGTDSAASRFAAVGMFSIGISTGGNSPVTAGEEDQNDNGTVSSQVAITGGTLTQLDANSGRGTFSLTNGAGTTNYVYYVVSTTELVALETDASGPFTLMDLLAQQTAGASGTFTNASLKGQSVVQLSGVDGSGGSSTPVAAVGGVAFDGAGNIAGPVINSNQQPGYYTDQSVGGTVTPVKSQTGTYNVDATCGAISSACGRVTVNLPDLTYQQVWYLSAANQAFTLDTSPFTLYGSLQPQTVPTGGFTIVALLGSYLGSTLTPVLPSITNELDVAVTPCCGGKWGQKYDASGPGGIVTQAQFDGAYDCDGTAPACDDLATAYGRFEVTGPGTDPGKPQIQIMYVLGSATSGITGTKGGLISINVGQQADGTVDPNPRLTLYNR
jgi:hypothetical protein